MASKKPPSPPPPTKDLAGEVDAFIMALAADGKKAELPERIKVGQVLVKYMQVKAGLPDSEQGSAWEES